MPTVTRVLAILLVFLWSDVKSQDQQNYFREWLASDGRRLEGAIESIDIDRDDPTVRILVKDSVARDIRLDKLSEVDQAYVRLQQINADDRQQFELVTDHIEAIRTTPQSVAGILQQIGRDQKLSPYASVWCCIANAAGDNDQEKGIVACRDAIRRINEQRKLDPSRHSRTLSAAHNNLGVCYIKQRDGDAAASQFISALKELDYVTPVLSHNIGHLLEMKDKPEGLRLEPKSVTALQRTMAGRRILEPRKKMQQGWYYSLDLDVPQGFENELSVAGVLSPHPTLELIASGTGIVVAPGYVLTVRSAVTHPDRSAFLTTVGVPLNPVPNKSKEKSSEAAKQWKQLPVRRLIVTLPETKIVGGTSSVAVSTSEWNANSFGVTDSNNSSESTRSEISGAGFGSSPSFNQGASGRNTIARGRSDNSTMESGVVNARTCSDSTNYIVIHPKDGPEKELAVLQVDGLRTKHVAFSDKSESSNDLFQIASFERGPEMLRNGLQFDKGKILGQGKLSSELRASIPFSGGQRGAALHDPKFLVIGLASNTTTGKDGIALSASSIRAWFEENVKAASLSFTSEQRDIKDIETATVPIFVWGKRSDTEIQNPLYNQFFNDDNLIEMHVLRDQYCIACRGKGNVTCTQCKGQGTVQNGLKEIITGTNPRTGQPITNRVVNMVPCPTCKTGRKHICPICKGNGENPGGSKP
ncbi:MAG: hypothetical protein ACK57V_05670 [Pirellula sp.]|jgi:hypothetical protein